MRGEPSLRTPYAPGQRASHGPRRVTPPDEGQSSELEITAIYEEIVVSAQDTETLEDQDAPGQWIADRQAPRADQDQNPEQDRDQAYLAHRYNGHTHETSRRNGPLREHEREREHERDHSYTPAHQRPPFERDVDRDESFAGLERETAAALPRGDVRGDVGPLIDDLKALFQRDRAIASASGGTRCGICYLHYPLDELEYRDAEGYYVCPVCVQALGAARVPMVRRQKRG